MDYCFATVEISLYFFNVISTRRQCLCNYSHFQKRETRVLHCRFNAANHTWQMKAQFCYEAILLIHLKNSTQWPKVHRQHNKYHDINGKISDYWQSYIIHHYIIDTVISYNTIPSAWSVVFFFVRLFFPLCSFVVASESCVYVFVCVDVLYDILLIG